MEFYVYEDQRKKEKRKRKNKNNNTYLLLKGISILFF